MKEPPYYMQAILHGLESVVVSLKDEYPLMVDNDVEVAFTRLLKYYKAKASNKDFPEPEVSSERKQALIDEMLNVIDAREEIEADVQFVKNPEVLHGEHQIPSLEFMYSWCFKRLINSLRFWRKERGKKGYINFISDYVR